MSAIQQGVEAHRHQSELDLVKAEVQALKADNAAMKLSEAKSRYERDLTGLMALGYELKLDQEMSRAGKWNYEAGACGDQIESIKTNYSRAPVGDFGPFAAMHGDLSTGAATLPMRPRQQTNPEGVSEDMTRKAVRYAERNQVTFNEALEKIRTGAA